MKKYQILMISALLSAATASVANAQEAMPIVYSGEFPRLDFNTVMPTGQSVAVECQDADVPYAPYDWPDAAATLEIRQGGGAASVEVIVSGAKPNTLYTMWVRLRGFDSNGDPFGGNPLVSIPGNPDLGIPGTPLIPSSYLPKAIDAVHAPVTDPTHGFLADAAGNGSVKINLDYPVIGGAFPFQRTADFDPNDERYTLNDPRNIPVAIVGERNGAPFTLRLASHCVDGRSHGLLPGPHEGWFDWKMP